MSATQSGRMWNRMYTCAFIIQFLFGIVQFISNPLIARFADSLGASEYMVGLVSGLYFGVALALRPVTGPMTAKMNKKYLLMLSLLVGLIANVGYALARNLTLFIVARFFQGVQFAFIGSLMLTIAADSLSEEYMATGVGMIAAGSAIAMAIAPSIGIALRTWGEATYGTLLHGYTVVFLTSAACQGLALFVAYLMPYTHRRKEELDSLGPWYQNIFAKEALLPTAALTFFSLAHMVVTIYLEPHTLARSIPNVGLYFSVYAFSSLVARAISGKLARKYGNKKVLFPAVVLLGLSYLVIGVSRSLITLLFAAAISALGSGLSQPLMQVMTIQSVPPAKRAVASNTQYFGMDIGNFLGPQLAALVYKSTKDYANVFYFGMVPVAVALLTLLVGIRTFERRRAAQAVSAQ